MGTDIICDDCGQQRSNAAFKNTRYCKACRLLRDLVFLEDWATRKCKTCRHVFAPVSRRDVHCGSCCFGSIDEGLCKFCGNEHAELYRRGIAVCVKCVREPRLRRSIVSGLKKGQRDRRLANHHAPMES